MGIHSSLYTTALQHVHHRPTCLSVTLAFALYLLCAMSATSNVHAQDYLAGEGTVRLGGTVSFTTQGGDYYAPGEADRVTTINLNPSASYFVRSGLALGLDAQLQYQAQGDFSISQVSLGPSASYFFGGPDVRIYPFVSVTPVYARTSQGEGDAVNGFGGLGSVGMAFQVARNVAITTEGFYRYLSFSAGGSDDSVSGNTFGIRAGVSGFLY